MSVTLLIVGLWQYCVCCIRSGVARCTRLMMRYLDRMCKRAVTHVAMVSHRYHYAPPRCRTSQYRRAFVPLSMSLWNDLTDPIFDGVGLAGFKSKANAFFPFLFFLSIGWYFEVGVFGLIGCISLSRSLALPTSFNNNNNQSHTTVIIAYIYHGFSSFVYLW